MARSVIPGASMIRPSARARPSRISRPIHPAPSPMTGPVEDQDSFWDQLRCSSNTWESRLAVADSYSVNAGSTLVVNSASGLLANDIDINKGQSGIQLIAELVNGPTNGQLSLSLNGAFSYTPKPASAVSIHFAIW